MAHVILLDRNAPESIIEEYYMTFHLALFLSNMFRSRVNVHYAGESFQP